MVYTSVPPYLHPPNWSQQQQPPASAPQGLQGVGMTGVTVGSEATQQLPQASSSIARPSENSMTVGARPTSMAERARLARVPQPEAALKCPRCDSTNTKFCYFNNYSLSQPRHFCKNCRRYWTRGGALRNVPVGGGCRRNKRSKSRTATIERPSGNSTAAVSTGVPIIPSTIAQLPYMGSFHSLHDYGAPSNVVGLSYGNVDPHVGSSSAVAGGGFEQWRLQQQQLPFLSGLEQPSSVPTSSSLGLYHHLDGEEGGSFVGQVQAKPSVKVEESSQDQLRLRTQYHGMNPSGDRYWDGAGTSSGNAGSGGANWGDLSATFASSTMGHLL